MLGMEWSNEQTLRFMEYYRNERVIWDPKHLEHKIRNKVYDAWCRIAAEMGNNVTVDVLKKKKDSVMASYRTYAKRVRISKKSGAGSDDVFKPTWFLYDVMHQFLATTTKPRETFTSEVCTNTSNTSNIHAMY